MHSKSDRKQEEQQEKQRHDDYYKKESQPRILAPVHWEKFDSIDRHIHGYTYSVKCLGNIKDKRVLDLGCGTGWFSVILAKRGALVDAIDISSEAINIAAAMAKINEVVERTSFRAGSVYELDYPENYFDLVIGQAILHHLRHKDKVVMPLYRIIKPGGRAVFCEPFGESRTLERIRLAVPVPVDEEDKTHWDEQFKYRDLDTFRALFKVRYREFQLLSRLDRLISYGPFVNFLGHLDLALLRYFPFLRRYARSIVVELVKPKAKSTCSTRLGQIPTGL
ncbi:MAG: class I SAM-dependent methyltransferase [Desulfobacterales bacterium]|nr:class I SAM-dependent methyltransferase [Desulfobacterales bacterium]